jgi:hypothetical protein
MPARDAGFGLSDHDPEASAADLTPLMMATSPEDRVQPKV